MKKYKLLILLVIPLLLLLPLVGCEEEPAGPTPQEKARTAVLNEIKNFDYDGTATVAVSGDNITVTFDKNKAVADIRDSAIALIAKLKTETDSGTLKIGEKEYQLSKTGVEEDIAYDLLFDNSTAILASHFLGTSTTITSPYSASIKKDGVTFPLNGTLIFKSE